jgi:septal ring factor EnvC (AmiA/AmiB activator)
VQKLEGDLLRSNQKVVKLETELEEVKKKAEQYWKERNELEGKLKHSLAKLEQEVADRLELQASYDRASAAAQAELAEKMAALQEAERLKKSLAKARDKLDRAGDQAAAQELSRMREKLTAERKRADEAAAELERLKAGPNWHEKYVTDMRSREEVRRCSLSLSLSLLLSFVLGYLVCMAVSPKGVSHAPQIIRGLRAQLKEANERLAASETKLQEMEASYRVKFSRVMHLLEEARRANAGVC